MIRRQRVLLMVATGILLSSLAACGQNSSNTGGNIPSLIPTTLTQTAPSPTETSGPVTLQIGAASYQPNETIEVTLRNASAFTIYFPDHLTNCTVIRLQHQVNMRWENVNPCRLMIATFLHPLDAWQSLMVQLVPTPTRLWDVGLYQATLSYSMAPASGSPPSVYSAGFQVT